MEYAKLVKQHKGKYKRILCHTLSTDFRNSTHVVDVDFPINLGNFEVIVKNHFLGVNASDINFTNGRYDPTVNPPFPCGFESVGEVKAVGSHVKHLRPGDPVGVVSGGCFSEFCIVPQREVVKVPFVAKEVLPSFVCGCTASMALEHVGEMKSGETVLVTAAAGATGQYAVQLAKLAGNHVIGTCSTQDKVDRLVELGCDRVINYKEENVTKVLKEEYPKGVDIVFESVGGAMFEAAVNNLAVKGRLIVIGSISGYQDNSSWGTPAADGARQRKKQMPFSMKLLTKSASVRGFFYFHYINQVMAHGKRLNNLIRKGLLDPGVDPTEFKGLEGVADAIDHMYARKNIGKVVVSLNRQSRL